MTTRREGPGWEDSDEGLLAQAEYADAAQQGTNWEAEAARLRRLLEDLTPGGSEFHNDPDYCARHIRVRSGLFEEENMGDRNELIRLRAENERLKRWVEWGQSFRCNAKGVCVAVDLTFEGWVVDITYPGGWRNAAKLPDGTALEAMAKAEEILAGQAAPPQSP